MRCCVSREGQEAYVLRDHLTTAELADFDECEKSPAARKRFGILLRKARRAEDAPLKAALKAARLAAFDATPAIPNGFGRRRRK